ncbi:MAG: hypothetical protein Q8L24_02090 [bacterium]|nr:hypothetical protein [bacterium]
MKIIWCLLWVLLIAHLIALPFWHKIFGAVFGKEFSSKILRFVVKAAYYSAIPVALAFPLALIGGNINWLRWAKYVARDQRFPAALAAVILLAIVPILSKTARAIIKKIFCPKVRRFLVGAATYKIIFLALLASLMYFSLQIGKREIYARMQPRNVPAAGGNNGWVDVRGEIHTHCYLSHDSRGTPEEISRAAQKNGIRWVIFTDHLRKLPPGNYPNYVNGVLFIYGSERNGPEKSSQFWASLKDLPPTLHLHGHLERFCRLPDEEKWKLVDGKSFALLNDDKWQPLDAIELVNFHANAFENSPKILGAAFFKPEDLYDGLLVPLPELFDYWQTLAKKADRPIPIFAAPDAHQNIKILGIQMDPYELTLGLISTHIWIERGKELNRESIFEAIKQGRTYIAFDYLGDPTGFQFSAVVTNDAYYQTLYTGGIAVGPKYLLVKLPDSENTPETEIRLYRDNHLDSIGVGGNTEIENPAPGFWRTEIWKHGKLWIISGQILIK